jgi:uncharacterized delta-60 repeat protein
MKLLLICALIFSCIYSQAQSAGSLDPTFGTGGKVLLSSLTGQDKAQGVVLQTDGKIVIGGFTTNSLTGKDFLCLRYNSDGSLDNTFGTNGIVITDLQTGSEDVAYSIALQTDGKIILAGSSDNGSNKNGAIVRYLTDGSIDSTFGINGIVTTDYDNNQQDELKVVKIHPLTGNIIVGGTSVISSTKSKPVIARYLSNGTIDSSFNTDGIRLLWITSLDYQYLFTVEDLVVQPNGKISAIGWRDFPSLSWDSDFWAGRINSDGSMDPTFSTDGVAIYNGGFNGHDRGFGLLVRPNNNLLMAGGTYATTLKYDFSLIEIQSNGSSGGIANGVDFGSTLDDIAYALNEDMNGKFVLAGSSGTSTSKSFGIARRLSTGLTDTSFGTSGKVTTTFGSNLLNECFDMVIQPDNKIVAVGYSGNDIAIARYIGTPTPDLNNFQLLSPSNLAINQNFASLTIDWSDAFLAATYELLVDTDQNFTSPQTFSSINSSKTVTNLNTNTTYYWKVRANDGMNWGNYSVTWQFSTNSLENFNLVTPASNAINQEFVSLLFDWTNLNGATDYNHQLSPDINFITNVQTNIPTNSTITLSNLLPSTDYFWRVRATSTGNIGAWSGIRKFTTKASSGVGLVESNSVDFIIYPNPTNGTLSLETQNFNAEKLASIYNSQGLLFYSFKIDQELTSIDISHLSAGVYYLSINDEISVRHKIVKR